MINGKTISVREIIENVFRDNDYDLEVSFPDVVEWVGSALDLISCPLSFIEKVTDDNTSMNHPPLIKILDYKGDLPCDFYQNITCRDGEHLTHMRYATDTFHITETDLHMKTYFSGMSDITYKIQNNKIFTSFKEGTVQMAYLALPVDEDGFPLIPDDQKFKQAIQSFIRMKIDYKLWRKGQIAGAIFEYSEREWLWYCGAAGTKAKMPSIDKMESIKNTFVRLIPDMSAHLTNFRFMGRQELYRNRNSF